MKYILIAFIVSASPQTVTEQFGDEAACRQAAAAIEGYWAGQRVVARATCLPYELDEPQAEAS